MSASVLLQAVGLNIQPNQLDPNSMPPGSLTVANNVIIRRDNVIESRRGYKLYGESFGTGTDRAKQLATYKNRILRHFASTLQYDTGILDAQGDSIFNSFAGSYLEPETGRRIRFIEANSNFYFTTSEGIKKISAVTAETFTTAANFITNAGGIKALDLTTRLSFNQGNQSGWFVQDSAVAYRVVWGTIDNNNNLILGTPSERSVIFNSLNNLLLADFMTLLGALDDTSNNIAFPSLISDADYVSTLGLPTNASATQIRNNLIALAEKIDTDILYANDTGTGAPLQMGAGPATISTGVATITFTSGDANDYLVTGQKIFLSGFTPTTGTLDGEQTIASVDPGGTFITFNTSATGPVTTSTATINSDTFRAIPTPASPDLNPTNQQLVDIQAYMSEIITQLQLEPTTGTPPTISSDSHTKFIDTLDITTTATVILDITIPQEVTSDYFFQIYRSPLAIATGTSPLSDVSPSDELQLVFEGFPSAADLTAHHVTIEDITPDAFRGANLYTNATTGQGILQANDVPPFAKDINRFKNVVFYANTRTRHKLAVNLLGVANMITDYQSGLNTQTFTSANVNTSTDTITITSHGYVSGQAVEFNNTTPSNLPGGLVQGQTYFVLNATTNTFQVSLVKFGTPVNLTSGGTGTHSVLNQLPAIVITDGTSSNTTTYHFVTGLSEITEITTNAGSTLNSSGDGSYFLINSYNDLVEYYVWYQIGTSTDPSISGKFGIRVEAFTTDTATEIATKTADSINRINYDFSATSLSNVVTVTTVGKGITTDASSGTSGFATPVVTQQGRGEDATTHTVLLSTAVSPAQAVDETARSFERVINKNPNGPIYAYYLSGASDIPGKLSFEERTLSNTPFYILANNSNTGLSFNPDLSPEEQISTISVSSGSPLSSTITTASPHGLINRDQVVIVNTNSTPIVDGLFTITYISPTSFSIVVNITVAGNQGAIRKATNAPVSDNEVLPNRIYFSKVLQPEAVPIVNTIDVGAKDKQILRIFPLRDSLFVFKEDGLFRISGEQSPFSLSLFDSSVIVLPPDSVDVSNNLLYCWTTKGLQSVSEAGVETISRPIDTKILSLATEQYTNFKTATWGIGYESDNSYTVYTVNKTTDTVATIGYRYSTLTHTWTVFDKTATCGVINSFDGKQYLGAGDVNFLEQERKDFTRYDYADREIDIQLTADNFFGTLIRIEETGLIIPGDVLVQNQYITIYDYNSILKKMDIDVTLQHDYFSTLEMFPGDDPRTKIDALLTKIANDPTRIAQGGSTSPTLYENYRAINSVSSISSISADSPTLITSTAHGLQTNRVITITGSDSTPSIDGTFQVTVIDANTFTIPLAVTVPGTTGTFTVENDNFQDIQASFNGMVILMNADTGVAFSNYNEVTLITVQEAIITNVQVVNNLTRMITLNLNLPFMIGPMIIFKSISTKITWAPQTLGDALGLKHMREATLIFENKAFTTATMSFATDLLPKLNEIQFDGDGNGIFGFTGFGTQMPVDKAGDIGFGGNFFGGGSNSVPFRTYIPRDCQRCRYLVCQFTHNIAREQYAVFGLSLTGEISQSTRAFR